MGQFERIGFDPRGRSIHRVRNDPDVHAQIKGENVVKFRSIVCLLASLVLFVLALRGGSGFTVHVYSFVLLPRYLVLAAIALLIPACVSAFAPHS